MLTRAFLGWNEPFLNSATSWLLDHRNELPHWLVIVPTSQAGRRLREAMAAKSGALLSPQIMTPGALMKTPDPSIAADWIERVAWQEVLENIHDWAAYEALFPQPPQTDGEWAGGLAMEMLNLRRKLQENGLTLNAASRMLSTSVEAERWDALARIEQSMEQSLRSWGFQSRSRILTQGITLPSNISGIILAGISEMPPIVERSLSAWNGPVTALIGAPESEATHFSDTGKPLDSWASRNMPWPDENQGSVHVTANSREQAKEALSAVTKAQSTATDVALGSADTEAGDDIANAFSNVGWTAFHPAAKPVLTGLKRWFKTWSRWLLDPKLATMMDLLALPETSALITGDRAMLAEWLSSLRHQWMVIRPDDLRHRISKGKFRSAEQAHDAKSVLSAAEALEQWRTMLLRSDFTEPLQRLLATLGPFSVESAETAAEIRAWLFEASPLIAQLKRSAKFWLELMLSSLPLDPLRPPDGRVIDVQGWLELFFEPGRHLVLCGLNEGKVPASNTGDPWLGESATKFLGLLSNADRAARDAFLYQSMLESRLQSGRVDLICAKATNSGDPLLPSRLLLAAPKQELPARVKFLFREIEPPEAGLRWQTDWQWQAPVLDVAKRFNATSFSAYLACPFRFYLKHAAQMQATEPDRVEWNARDFGNVAHEILERWGRDETARHLADPDAIHEWVSAQLDVVVDEWFGQRVPLAIRIQTESLRQRMLWFARTQAQNHADGWDVIEVEHKFEIATGSAWIVAKIDRIDRHRETGQLRVIDYKTGKVESVDQAHRRMIKANTTLPLHLPADSPAVFKSESKGKPSEFRWINLQLPLYALAIHHRDGLLPVPCYFTLGNTESNVALSSWDDFSDDDLNAAKACAHWIAEQISAGIFWPPADKVQYDEFAHLSSGRRLAEMVKNGN